MAAIAYSNPAYRKTVRQVKQQSKFPLRRRSIAEKENMRIAEILNGLKSDLDYLYNSFDCLTDPILVDGCIYEIKALHMKYQYYLKLYKEGGGFATGQGGGFVAGQGGGSPVAIREGSGFNME